MVIYELFALRIPLPRRLIQKDNSISFGKLSLDSTEQRERGGKKKKKRRQTQLFSKFIASKIPILTTDKINKLLFGTPSYDSSESD